MTSTLKWVGGVVLIVLVAGVIAALTVPRSGDRSALGPDNPAPSGARAVVEILRRQGVEVRQLRNSQAVLDRSDAQTAVVVTDTALLGPDQLERLASSPAADLILVQPDELTLSRLAPSVHAAGDVAARVLPPGCDQPDAAAAGKARGGGPLYFSTDPNTAACYRTGSDAGSYLVDDVEDSGRHRVTVIGQAQLLENQYLDQDGDAALALRSLGRDPKLLWYSPDPLELGQSGQAPSLTSQLPRWVLWALIQLTLAVLVAMIWRGRRLGRLVSEPLPIVVRAAETQEGRARLYRQSRARGRAAATLRTATLRRLATGLGVPPGSTPERLIDLLAVRTGRDALALREVLLGPAPESDAELVTLADRLDELERDAAPARI